MNLNWLESLLYGLISGLSEFLPISSYAHQQIFLHIFGDEARDPARDLIVHIALIVSLFIAGRTLIEQFRRDNNHNSSHRRQHNSLSRNAYDVKLIKNAAVPMLILMLVFSFVFSGTPKLFLVCLFLLMNSIILFIPAHLPQGNKDARSMSAFDSLLIGLSGALSIFAGISRIGTTISFAVGRGADRRYALNWALILSIPALFLTVGLDFLAVISAGGNIQFWSNFLTYILSALGAFTGGYLSIILVKLINTNFGLTGFAYYSCGASLFSFIIYLTIV